MSELLLLSALFDSLPLGIVVLDPAGRTVIFNRAEEVLAGRKREDVLGREFFVDIAPCMNVRQLAGEFAKIGRQTVDVEVEFSFPFLFLEDPRDVRVKLRSFDVGGVAHGFLMIEDVTKARALDRMKESLQSLLVHDLKNPLGTVVANLGFLDQLGAVRDNADAEEAIRDSLDAASRLQRMFLNLLDITRLETSSFPLQRKPTDVASLVREAADGNAASARTRGARVSIDVPGTPLIASLDAVAMRRILDNLLDNAFRHAKNVVVSVRAEGANVVFQVEDDGPGIPEAVRAAIFEKYTQVVDGGARNTGDNRGLGLTFVKMASRAHGGDAVVECPPAGGSRFRVELPSEATTTRASTRPRQ